MGRRDGRRRRWKWCQSARQFSSIGLFQLFKASRRGWCFGLAARILHLSVTTTHGRGPGSSSFVSAAVTGDDHEAPAAAGSPAAAIGRLPFAAASTENTETLVALVVDDAFQTNGWGGYARELALALHEAGTKVTCRHVAEKAWSTLDKHPGQYCVSSFASPPRPIWSRLVAFHALRGSRVSLAWSFMETSSKCFRGVEG